MDPERLAGIFVIGVEGAVCDAALTATLAAERPGGLIVFQRNLDLERPVTAARVGLIAFVAALRDRLGERPFLMIDHEGGRVHRLGECATRFPPPGELSPHGEARVVEVCRQQADELRALGFNTILGPVLDVCPATGTASHIAARSYSGEPQRAAALGAAAVGAFLERGLLPVPKHFPGYGAAPIDPHLDLPTRADPWDALRATDLVPFAAVAPQAPALMTAHIVATARDAELPCTLSPAWLRTVRDELGFTGCLVSDDLCMASVRDRYGPPELAERALRAGLDLLLVCHPQPGSLQATREHLLAVAARDPAFAARLDDAATRVEAARAQLEPTPAPAPTAALFERGVALRAALA